MNKEFWKKRIFTPDDPLHYQCPYCKQGIYKPFGKKCKEEITSLSYPNGPNTVYLISLILKCTHCENIVVFTADMTQIDEVETILPDGRSDYKTMKYIEPKSIYPPIPIIRCDGLPTPIMEQLYLSFFLFYYNIEACAAALRKTIELILTDKNNNENSSSLNEKIQTVKNEWLKALLNGIKELGNTGIHGNFPSEKITITDILDGYELVENILDEYYYKSKDKVIDEAKAITDKFSSKRTQSVKNDKN